MRLTDVLTGLNRVVAYYPELCAITGGVGPTLLLCQLVYQSQRVANADGWFAKTAQDLEAETGLSRWEQQHARRQLRQRGFLQERHSGLPRRLFYRLDLEAINTTWDQHLANRTPAQTPTPGDQMGETHKPDVGKQQTGRWKNHTPDGGVSTSQHVVLPHHSLLERTTEKEEEKNNPPLPPLTGGNPGGVHPSDGTHQDQDLDPDSVASPDSVVSLDSVASLDHVASSRHPPQGHEAKPHATHHVGHAGHAGENGHHGPLWERFDRFWHAYPRKIGKGAARKAWKKLKPDEALLTQMLAAIEQQRDSIQWNRDDGQYIPLPSTWLKQERWEDELPIYVSALDGVDAEEDDT